MRLPRLIRWFMWVAVGMIGLLLTVLIFFAFLHIRIDLTQHKNFVEWTASRALGRPVDINGKISVGTSLWPSFDIEGLRIGNPPGFKTADFARLEYAKITLGIARLLQWKIHIREFTVKELTLSLLENENDAVNWSLSASEKPAEDKLEDRQPLEGRLKLTSDSFVLEKLYIENIVASYRHPEMAEPLEIHIDECKGSALVGEPFTISVTGRLFNETFKATVKAGSLQELLEENKSWSEIRINIAKTRFEMAGYLDMSHTMRTLDLKASAHGDRLDSLNGLLKLDLPPLKSYRIGTFLTARKGRLDLSDFEINVGESKLAGKMTIKNSDSQTSASLELSAPQVQLNDFVFKNWSFEKGRMSTSPGQPVVSSEKDSPAPDKSDKGVLATTQAGNNVMTLFSPDFLGSFNARLKISAEKVLSGKDKLGSGILTATLKEGRFSIDPLQLNIPGGSFNLSFSIMPGRESSDASVAMLMKNFDFGILSRHVRPDTIMGGTLNLDVNLKTSAKGFDELLQNATGYIDFSGHPENLQAGILDIWAVNLIAAIANSKDKNTASKINCVLCRWSVKDGILKPDAFVIDTNKIRICVDGKVDLKRDRIDFVAAPTPKKPEFFSLATPIEVKGKLSDFKMGIQTGGLVGTTIRFVTSPLLVPLLRMIGERLPEDGSDVCTMPIGQNKRPEKSLPGCGLVKATAK